VRLFDKIVQELLIPVVLYSARIGPRLESLRIVILGVRFGDEKLFLRKYPWFNTKPDDNFRCHITEYAHAT